MKPRLCLAFPHIGGRGRPPVASLWGPDFTLACFKHIGHAGGHRFRQMKVDKVRERLKLRAEIEAVRADKIPAPAPAAPSPPLDLFFPARGGIGRVHASVFGSANGNDWAWVARGRDMGEFMPFGESWPRHADLLPLENAGEILPPTPPHAPNAPPNAPAPAPAPENVPQAPPECPCLKMADGLARSIVGGHRCGAHKNGGVCVRHGPCVGPFAARRVTPDPADPAPKPKTAPRAIVPPPNVNIPLGAALDLTQISASPSHNEARKKANESRFFEPLGEGAYRVTFRIIGSELVVKVATSKDGEKANLDEANRYLGFTDAQKDCVAPVLANDPNGKFVIMPLCKNVNNGASADLKARMAAANLRIGDILGHNCGELNGKQVIYDFGLFVR